MLHDLLYLRVRLLHGYRSPWVHYQLKYDRDLFLIDLINQTNRFEILHSDIFEEF
jgi:hypothetical protein